MLIHDSHKTARVADMKAALEELHTQFEIPFPTDFLPTEISPATSFSYSYSDNDFHFVRNDSFHRNDWSQDDLASHSQQLISMNDLTETISTDMGPTINALFEQDEADDSDSLVSNGDVTFSPIYPRSFSSNVEFANSRRNSHFLPSYFEMVSDTNSSLLEEATNIDVQELVAEDDDIPEPFTTEQRLHAAKLQLIYLYKEMVCLIFYTSCFSSFLFHYD